MPFVRFSPPRYRGCTVNKQGENSMKHGIKALLITLSLT
ncbi:hypothetical protein CRE02_28830, partial [Escherichia coli]